MKIKPITKADFPQLYTFWKSIDLWMYPYEEEFTRFKGMYILHPYFSFLGEEDEQVVGSILGAFDGRTLTIHRFAVDPKYRYKGYGTQLLQKLEKTAKEKGVLRIAGQIHEDNIGVLRFYEKLGYKKDDTIDITKLL